MGNNGGGGVFSPEDDVWDEEEMIQCPACGQHTQANQNNVGGFGDNCLIVIFCDNFSTCTSSRDQAIVAIRFQSTWITEQSVMHRDEFVGADGLREVARDPTSPDRVALELLCRRYAKRDSHAGFHSIPLRKRAKIMWINGDAVGFYTFQYPGDFQGTSPFQDVEHAREIQIPVLGKIYVRQAYRRRGLGSAMIVDCFRCGDAKLDETKWGIELPQDETRTMLDKVLTQQEKYNLRETMGEQIFSLPLLRNPKFCQHRYSKRLPSPRKRVRYGDLKSIYEVLEVLKACSHPAEIPRSIRKCDLYHFITEGGGYPVSSSATREELICIALKLL